MSPAKRLVLIDGMAVVYRAFFAIRELSTSSGRPTNAVYGFIRMVEQARQWWGPTHWAVVFDGGLPVERTDRLEEYKAQRAPMPDALRSQLPTVNEYLELAGIASFREEGQEADDLIASAAVWAAPEADRILLATNDKDMYQLVGGNVCMASLAGKQTRMGREEVCAKTGVMPERIVDWLALMGDASDNIPGVPGVGPKTAAKLLNTYGSLQGIRDALPGMAAGKLRSALCESMDVVARNEDIVKLRTDLECGLTWDTMRVRDVDADGLLRFYEELEFDSLARALRERSLF